MAQNENKEVKKRLDVMIGLLLDISDLLYQKYKTRNPVTIQMARLKQLGLESSEIGLFFNKSGKEVAKLIYETKRLKKSKNKK